MGALQDSPCSNDNNLLKKVKYQNLLGTTLRKGTEAQRGANIRIIYVSQDGPENSFITEPGRKALVGVGEVRVSLWRSVVAIF